MKKTEKVGKRNNVYYGGTHDKVIFFILTLFLWAINSYQQMVIADSLSPTFFLVGFGTTIVSAFIWASAGYILCQIAAFFINLIRPDVFYLSLWKKMSIGLFLGILIKVIWNVAL